MGAIMSGRTICGALFGGAVYLGYLKGINTADAPKLKDARRTKAIQSVGGLYNGFIERFRETDCQTLTGCDWSRKEDVKRYFKDEIYKDTCFRQFEYVIEKCISEKEIADESRGPTA
jgi:hypothetical protein